MSVCSRVADVTLLFNMCLRICKVFSEMFMDTDQTYKVSELAKILKDMYLLQEKNFQKAN